MAAIDDLRDRIAEHAIDVARRAADLTVERTQAAASRRSGALAAGISHDEPFLSDAARVMCEIRSEADYSVFQDDGTGIYGPRGMPIIAMGPKPMTFFWDAIGQWRSLRISRGAPGRHFFRTAMPERWREALAESLGS